MEGLRERPGTLVERYLSMIGILLAAAGSAEMVLRILADTEQGHPYEFVGLTLQVGLALYLLWELLLLVSVRYTLEGDRLTLRQGATHTLVELRQGAHLHRWRRKWSWSGGAQKELGVADIALFPPLWVGRAEATWVLSYPGSDGRQRAVAFRPSGALLEQVRELIRSPDNVAG